MDQLINCINKLQDIFATIGSGQISLPQIAVVGSQSSGKSSVLETIVGKDFLPRGCGIVTRRPLVLQLINSTYEYGEFLHKRGTKFTNFEDIRREIEIETDRITGKTKNISKEPINLTIYSPNVINLTLIDLPGLTKVAVEGQPSDIGVQIRDLVLHYIKQKNTIILAISASNVDLANSDAIQIAKEVDPNGERTIGVMTKPDLCDNGTNILSILNGESYHLKHGFIAVKNRSQDDINKNIPIQKARESEMLYFYSHPDYSSISEKQGTMYLAKKLNEMLGNHIKSTLPFLKKQLEDNLTKTNENLNKIEYIGDNETKFLELLQNFNKKLTMILYGSTDLSNNSDVTKLKEFFNVTIYSMTKTKYSNISADIKSDVRKAIQNSGGIERGTIFVPDAGWKNVCKFYISMFNETINKFISMCKDELINILMKSSDVLINYTKLKELVEEILLNEINILEQNCKDYMQQYINIQSKYINDENKYFRNMKTESIIEYNVDPNKIIFEGTFDVQKKSEKIFGSDVKQRYFQLTSITLTEFSDNIKNEKKNTIHIQGLYLKDVSDKNIQLYDNTNLVYDIKSSDTTLIQTFKSWLLYTGVQLAKKSTTKIETEDLKLNGQIETSCTLVDSYMDVFLQNISCFSSGAFKALVIDDLLSMAGIKLQIELKKRNNLDMLLSENQAIKQKRESLIAISTSLKRSLEIIKTINIPQSQSQSQNLTSTSISLDVDNKDIKKVPPRPKQRISTKVNISE
jgi:dynamin 1/3